MRNCMLLGVGLLAGFGLHAATAQTLNTGLVQLNHVQLSVPNINETVAYYTNTLGFPEAFRVNDEKGQPRLVYVQISKGTFVEIGSSGGRPASLGHFGIHVEDVEAASSMFKQRGAMVGEVNRTSPTKALLGSIIDVNGLRIELAQLPPESMHRQAMDRWK